MGRAADFMLTPEELRLKRKRRRHIITLVLMLAIALAIGLVAARPTRDAIKGWQARRHAAKAFSLIDKQEWSSARDEAAAAYQLRSSEPQAIRAVARLLSRAGQPQALDFWDELRKLGPLTRDDLRDEAAIALSAGNTFRAESVVKQLMARDPASADLLLDAQLAAQGGSDVTLRVDCEKIFSDRRATRKEQLQATWIELRGSPTASKEQTSAAWRRVETLAQGDDSVSLDALILLAQRALSSNAGGTGAISSQKSLDDKIAVAPAQLATSLQTHPLAQASHKLVAFDLLERVGVAERHELIERAIAQFKMGDSADLAALMRWLNSKGEHQKVIDSITAEQALKSRDAFLQYLDALGALGRWAETKALLESDRFPLEPFLQHMYVARCNSQLDEKTAAENNWQRALEAASGDPQKLIRLGDFAAKNGVLDVAGSAFERATTEAPKLRPAWQARLRLVQLSRDTAKIHAVLAEMLAIWPNDTSLQNDEAYTRLLLMPTKTARTSPADTKPAEQLSSAASASSSGIATSLEAADPREAQQIEELAGRLVHEEPTSLAHRTLLALAHLRAGHADHALDAYGIEIAPNVLTPQAIAVRAAALAANGRAKEASTTLSSVVRGNLVLEERSLIEQID
jgi:hypothetical protein